MFFGKTALKKPAYLSALLVWLSLLVGGCATSVIVAPVGEPVILSESVSNVPVLLLSPSGEWVQGRAQSIPAGWACWYPSDEDF